MSKLSFLDGEPSEAETVSTAAPEPTASAAPAAETPPAEAVPAQPRAADGKFAPKAGEAAAPLEPSPAQVVAAVVPPAPEPGHVPIGAMLDEREKRQALERRVAEFEAAEKAKAVEAARTPPPEFTEDPEGHLNARQADYEAQLYYQKRDFCRRLAELQHGKETVAKVGEWAKAKGETDAQFNQQALLSDDPYEFAMQAWKRDQVVNQVSPDDLEDYLAWRQAKAAAALDAPIAAAPAAPSQTTPKPPPRSLADAPSAGGPAHVPSGPGQAFAGVFGQA